MAQGQQFGQPQDLSQAFKKEIKEHFSFVMGDLVQDADGRQVQRPVLLAISGGMDSMVLAQLLQEAIVPAIWVHCNFHLRGAESDRDEAFVRDSAARLGVPLIVKDFETKQMAARWKMSIEETARKLRYDFFNELLQNEEKFREQGQLPLTVPRPAFLMTAHHGNDQVETLLLNFFRGCGISGLHGIPVKNKKILRPLLGFKRTQLEDYARSGSMQWVEDSSNQSTAYTRNFLRHTIIPSLKTVYPAIEDNLLANIQRFGQAETLYQKGLAQYKRRLMNFQGGHLQLSVLLLQKSGIAATLLWEVLKDYGFGFRQIPEIEKLLKADSGAYQDNAAKDYRILRNRAHLVLSSLKKETAAVLVLEKQMDHIDFPQGCLTIKAQQGGHFELLTDPRVAQLDSRLLVFPLLLRKWKPGDYFYPLGMRKKKKIARFLIDSKLGMHEKEQVWVVESQGRIVWVVGLRLDDRFKITAATKNILKLKLDDTNDCPK